MGLLPIVLGATREQWGKSKGSKDAPRVDPDDAEVRSRIFERDNHTCQFCGFVSKKYQELSPKNGDPRDTTEDNLITTCIFCRQCFQLEAVGEMRSGALIWLPELEQAALHHIARAIYIARVTPGPMADAARAALDVLIQRRDEAKSRLGTDDATVLGAVLMDYLEDKHYADRAKRLDGIRLMPLDRRIIREGEMEFNQFPQILAYWRSKDGPFSGVMPAAWPEMFDRLGGTA